MDAQHLHAALEDVCPTLSVRVEDPSIAPNGLCQHKPEATQPQIDAGNNVIATIPINPKSTMATGDFIGRFTNAEYLAATAETWRTHRQRLIAKNWDIVPFDPSST